MLESLHLLKRVFCNMALPLINTTSPSPLSYSVVTFCNSNSTVFETSLQTLNQVCVCIHTDRMWVCACMYPHDSIRIEVKTSFIFVLCEIFLVTTMKLPVVVRY